MVVQKLDKPLKSVCNAQPMHYLPSHTVPLPIDQYQITLLDDRAQGHEHAWDHYVAVPQLGAEPLDRMSDDQPTVL